MYQVHLTVVIGGFKFAQALGPRDELDERQSLRTSDHLKLSVCPEPALSCHSSPRSGAPWIHLYSSGD